MIHLYHLQTEYGHVYMSIMGIKKCKELWNKPNKLCLAMPMCHVSKNPTCHTPSPLAIEYSTLVLIKLVICVSRLIEWVLKNIRSLAKSITNNV